MQTKHQILIRRLVQISSWAGLIATLVLGFYFYQQGYLTDEAKLNELITGLGFWGPLVFVFLQIIQVVIPIIPGGISTAVGVVLFGGFWGFVWNYVGIVIGSFIVFHISKIYGRSLLEAMFKKDLLDKYHHWTETNNRFTKLFAWAIFLPVAPDDFLCYLAGTTSMSYRTYALIILLGKVPSIMVYSFGLTQLYHFFL